jgi:outer membrane protein TolC
MPIMSIPPNLRSLVLIVLAPVCMGAAPTVDGPLPETPAEYARYALTHHSDLQGLYEAWQARLAQSDAAGASWPQPTVGYRTFIDGLWFDDPGTRHRVKISQKFPWPGVLKQAKEPARHEAAALRHRFEARALEILYEVRTHLIAIARLDAVQQIRTKQLEIYGDVIALLEQKMGSDAADYGDVIRLNRSREQLRDTLDVLKSKRRQRVAKLRRQLELPPEAELTFDFQGDRDVLDVSEELPETTKLVEMARTHNPGLKARLQEAKANRARAERARKKRFPWPQLTLGVDSIPDRMGTSGYDRRTAFMLDLTVPVPIILGQYRQERSQFEHQRRSALSHRDQRQVDLTSSIDAAVVRIDERRRRLRRYRSELLPLARDATEEMRQEIATGERDITDYLLSFQQEFDLETNVVEFRATIAQERARLEMLTGGALSSDDSSEDLDFDIRDARTPGADDE